VTQDASPRLHLVTHNHVGRLVDDERVDDEPVHNGVPTDGGVMADLVRRAEALDARTAAETTARDLRPAGLIVVGAALAVVLTLLGSQPWQLPHRGGSGVSAVPQSLLTFLLLCAAACVWAAGRVVQPAQTFRSPDAARVWWLVLAGAAVVSVTADLSLASYATAAERPGQLLLRCAVPVVPVVLAGLLARDDGRAARIRAALGTGVVTLPMTALGWALLASPAASPAGLSDALAMTLSAGLAPFVLAVAFVAADRRSKLTR
jgi:hypothetical protein